MAAHPKPRPTQTRVKHELLDRYLAIWGRIILNGVRKQAMSAQAHGRAFDMHMVYVDTNAFTGRYDGELEDIAAGRSVETVYGSAVVGVQALDRLAAWAEGVGITIRTNTILIEQRLGFFRELQATLREAGLSDRVRNTTHFASLDPGEIAVVNADWTSLVGDLVSYTQSSYTFALYLIDPYGPMAIPLDCVGEIVRQRHHDVIINMPYRDLHKKTGLATKREITPPQLEQREHYDRMFGSTRWQANVQRINPAIWQDNPSNLALGEGDYAAALEIEEELSKLYRAALVGVDSSVIVKSIRLLFPAHDLTMYYLYLTTHNADGALKMNELISEARLKEYRLRESLKRAKKQAAAGMSMLPLFGEIMGPPPKESTRPEREDIAEIILRRVGGRTMTRKELNIALVDEPFFSSEISKALTYLKRPGRAGYDGPLDKNPQIRISDPTEQ